MSSNQQFSLRWNNYVQHITHVFTSLRDEENLVDVTLCCEGKKIRAHKMLLSACSTYFREIFKENPCQHPVIIFRNVKYKDLEALISFMYKGEVNVEQEGLSSFLSTAELLEVKGLTGSGPCIPETVVDEDVSSSETKQTSKQSSSSPKCNKPDSPVSKKRKTVAVEEFSPPSTPKIKSEPEFTETDYYDNPGSPEIVKSEPMDSAWNNDENTETGNEGTAGTSNDGLQDTLQESPEVPKNYRKKKGHYCKFCKKIVSNFKRHLTSVHGNEDEIKNLVGAPRDQQPSFVRKIMGEGDAEFNKQHPKSPIELRKTSEHKKKIQRLGCPSCSCLVSGKHFYTHLRRCNKAMLKD